jgi:polysaccharide export outer membrane protein
VHKFWIIAVVCATAGFGQLQRPVQQTALPADAAANLPFARVGADDLLGIFVYDSPELTRTVRVAEDGSIQLPMLKDPVQVAGLTATEIKAAVVNALKKEDVMVQPVVAVSVVEYRSQPITVVGAVKSPLTFQAVGRVSLLDALSRAQGLSEDAGAEILISETSAEANGGSALLTKRIPVKGLIDGADAALNLELHGGEQILIPEGGRIFVVGNVKTPGAYPIKDSKETGILKALALSQGLMPYAGQTAYIFRPNEASGGKQEIRVELKKIMARKAPDVPLFANDVLYIPDATGRRATVDALEKLLAVGTGFGTAALYVTR